MVIEENQELVPVEPDTKMAVLGKSHAYSYAELKDLLKYMPKDVANAIINMPIERSKLQEMNDGIEKISSGIWSVFPMICPGGKCGYGDRCPLSKQNLAPITQDCPLESHLINKWMNDYIRDLSINIGSKTQMDQIGTIVMCDLMIMRIRNFMAKKIDGHIDESAVGVDNNGNVILKRDIAKEILIEEKYQRQKSKIQEELLATKEARAKYDVVDENDLGLRGAKLRLKAQELKQKTDRKADTLVKKAQFLENAANILASAPELEKPDIVLDENDFIEDDEEGDYDDE